jgi:hypothetical protein
MSILEQQMQVSLKAAEWLIFLGWLGGIAPDTAGPAEDIIHQLLDQLPELKAALGVGARR